MILLKKTEEIEKGASEVVIKKEYDIPENVTDNNTVDAKENADVEKYAVLSIKKVKRSKKKAKIFVSVSGYKPQFIQVQYAQNKKFTRKKKTINFNGSNTSFKISGLNKKKTYYFRARSLNTDVTGAKTYGKWSNIVKVKR